VKGKRLLSLKKIIAQTENKVKYKKTMDSKRKKLAVF
jgi:hypothetical protein